MNRKIDEEQLYTAAIKVFARYGYNRAKMSDVSSELNLASGTIYRYVSDKKELYTKSIEFGIRNWQAFSLNAIIKYEDPIEQLVVLVLSGYKYLKTDNSLHTIMVENPGFLSTSPVDDPVYEINRESIVTIKQIIDSGMKTGRFREIDSDSVAEAFFDIYMLFIIKIFIKDEGDRAWHMVRSGLEIILQGIISRDVEEKLPSKLLVKHDFRL